MRPIATYTVVSSMPEALSRLPELAYNIHWAWDHETIDLFRRLGGDLWEETGHNPVKMLGLISQNRLNALAHDDGFLAHLQRVLDTFDEYMDGRRSAWYPSEYGPEDRPQIAYFSFEFGLTESIPNYSGGLGVLAGDHLKAASDLNVPLIGVGLLYQEGYFRQYLNVDGWQQELYPENDFYTMPLRLVTDDGGAPVLISVELPGRKVHAQIWCVQVGRVSLYLLDTNIPNNSRDDQNLTDQLYGGDREMRIKQEILLGIGGLRALSALGLEPAVCHMNEGHSAFLALERARMLMERLSLPFARAAAITSAGNVFTTHTPVPAGNDYFAPELVEKYFKAYRERLGLSREEFLALGREDASNTSEHFCMTILALRMSTYANGVSRLHGETARSMWAGIYPKVPVREVPISAITNGVHTFSWISKDMAQLFDRYLGPRWRQDPTDPQVWDRAATIPDEELWRTHERRRERLVAFARRRLISQLEQRSAPPAEIEAAQEALDPDVLTVGFARRFATYKRATLLLKDPERFTEMLCGGDRPVQFIFAGKAHPHDTEGKEFIRQIVQFARTSGCRNRIVFLEDYDMVIARYLVQGCDIWLNMPRRPQEASATSGMKAVMNGVLHVSVLDGWWAEAYRHQVGWAIGAGETYADVDLQDTIEGRALYNILEEDIIPTFYDRGSDNLPRGWIARMKGSLRDLAPVYNTARMVQEYTRRFYHPALEQTRHLSANNYEAGQTFAAWAASLREHWGKVKIGSVTSLLGSEVRVGESLQVQAQVYLGSIRPEDVAVQLYVGVLDKQGEIERGRAYDMQHAGAGEEAGWHSYSLDLVSEVTGRHGLTARVVPRHPDARSPLRLGMITWAG